MKKMPVHLAISSSIMKMVLGKTKEVGAGLMCGTNEGRTHGTFVAERVDCATCKGRMKERRWDLLERFVRPDERTAVAEALASFGFLTGTVKEYSDSMLILYSVVTNGEVVYLRRVAGIIDGEMTTSKGLTVKNGDLWVEWFRFGEVLGSQLVRNHERWTQK